LDVAILGASGLIGQVFAYLLDGHPEFEVKVITGSRSVGELYGEYVDWKIWGEMPDYIKDMRIVSSDYKNLRDVDFVLSALPSSEAEIIEPILVRKGLRVVSNSSAMRLKPNVPLVIPEVNPHHLKVLESKYKSGFIVTSPNCSTTILSLLLKPIHDNFKVDWVHVVTMQSVSGAGYPGHSYMDISNNLIPFIPMEEWKLENECLKIFGGYRDGMFEDASFNIIAQVNRVPILYGHTESVLVTTHDRVDEVDRLKDVLENFSGLPQGYGLYSAPEKPIHLVDGPRPQPRYDVFIENGMAISVGRIKIHGERCFSAVIHGNNLVRGGAGGALLILEYLAYMIGKR
jgi:aspartate-semialdehyde dehydrogenase